MLSRLAKAKGELGDVFARERRIIEKASCCLRFDRGKLFKLIDDAEALYEAALEALVDEADKWMGRLEERIGGKGTKYLVAEWRGVRIEVIPGRIVGTILIIALRQFAEEVGMPYPSVEADIEPIEPIPASIRRRLAVGWHASDAFVDGKGRPGMETSDIGQMLSWLLAWPGEFRVAMRGLVIGREVRPRWRAYSLSHSAIELIPEAVGPANGDRIRSPKYRLIKMLSDPLALLAYTLGDGSPSIRRSNMREIAWAVAPNHMDELVNAVTGLLSGIGLDCVVKQNTRRRYVYVRGECASALAEAMLDALGEELPIGKRLLDAIYGNEPNSKYGRLVALANWISRRRTTPKVEVCGYVFHVKFDEGSDLFAEYSRSDVDAQKIAEAVKQCLGTVSGVRIVHEGRRGRVRLGTTVLEAALRKLAKEDPVKARQIIEAIVDYLLKRAEEYEARGKTKAAQWTRNKAKKLASFLHNTNNSDILLTTPITKQCKHLKDCNNYRTPPAA